jgi:hypothetical protein
MLSIVLAARAVGDERLAEDLFELVDFDDEGELLFEAIE